jgi:hypothetical protein
MTELFAFVIVPSRPEFVEFYTDVIRPILESAGYEAQHSENVFELQNSLKDQVLNIHRANIVVVDLTVPTAHVLYELGIAQGLLKPTILITQRIERMPFDLRSYRVLEYGMHYKRIEEFKSRLSDLAEKHKTGLIDYGNPVMDFIPNLIGSIRSANLLPEETAPASNGNEPQQQAAQEPVPHEDLTAVVQTVESAVETAATVEEQPVPSVEPKPETRGEQPKILGFAIESRQAMDKINTGVKRIAETTTTFTHRLNEHNGNIKTIRARGVNGDPKELREALNAAADEMEAYTASMEGETPNLRSAWERLLKNTTDLIASVSIESREDRETANLFAAQMQGLQGTVSSCTGELIKLKETIGRTPNISKNLNRAIIRGEQAVNAVAGELTTGQSYIQRTVNLLRERLNAPNKASEPITNK